MEKDKSKKPGIAAFSTKKEEKEMTAIFQSKRNLKIASGMK